MDEINEDLLTEMRGWVSDCVWADMDEEEIAELSRDQLLRGVEKHYVGGVRQFVIDCGELV